MTENKVVLAFAPHPDDETFFWGGTLSQFSRSGMETHVALLTNGDKGVSAYTDPASGEITTSRPIDVYQYTNQRKAEFLGATNTLGVRAISMLGFPDKGIDSSVVETLIDVILRVNPHIILSFSEAGTTLHPDHTATAYGLYSALVEILGNQAYADELSLELVLTSLLPRSVSEQLSKWSEADHPDVLEFDVRRVMETKHRAAGQYQTQAHLVQVLGNAGAFDQEYELYHRRLERDKRTGSLRALGVSVDPRDIPFILGPNSYISSHPNLGDELAERLNSFDEPKLMQIRPRVLSSATMSVNEYAEK